MGLLRKGKAVATAELNARQAERWAPRDKPT